MEHRLNKLTLLGVLASLAIAAACVMPQTAQADGMKDAATDVAPSQSWTGFSLGIGGGLSSLNSKLTGGPGPAVDDPGAAGASASLDGLGADGHFLSLTAGADYQFSRRFVVGGFFDYDFHDLSTDVSVDIPGIDVSARGSVEVDHSWTVGGRLGYLPSADTMIFVSAGYTRLGMTEIEARVSGPFPAVDASASAPSLSGAFLGAGFETRLTQHVSLRGEYRYTDFGTGDIDLPTVDGLNLNDVASVEVSPNLQTGRMSLNYRF